MVAWTHGQFAVLGAAMAFAAPLCSQPAEAYWSRHHAGYSGRAAARSIYAGMSHYGSYGRFHRSSYSVLQCVPFARENTGIELVGNAVNWWDNATGIYERGSKPEVGSVLNFRAAGRMYLGHVAVVSAVVDSRNVQIDHANWSGPGVITRNVAVVDVSPNNDWSAVRVALRNGDFGNVYPTYGFIYDRPDKGTMVANTGAVRTNAPALAATAAAPGTPITLTPGILDLRPSEVRTAALLTPLPDEEVAEATEGVGSIRTRRRWGRSMPAFRYVHAAGGSAARYGNGGAGLAYLGRSLDRMTAGRAAGRQVLAFGHVSPRGWGGREQGYASTVRTAGARAAVVRPVHGQARAGSRGSYRN